MIVPEEEHRITTIADLNRIVYGHQGAIILESPSGKTHIYQYCLPIKKDGFPEDVRFVYNIHVNNKEYPLSKDSYESLTRFYIGMIERDQFRVTHSSRFEEDTEVVKGARYLEKMRKNQHLFDTTPMKIYTCGICARCGHIVKDKKFSPKGYGKSCYYMIKKSKFFIENHLFDDVINEK